MNLKRLTELDSRDWLPSWCDGPAKRALLDFLQRICLEASAEFVAPADRLAVFNSAGTLWPEKPLLEAQLALARIHEAADRDPSLWLKQPFKAALGRDLHYLADAPVPAILELLARSHANLSQEQFRQEADAFVQSAVHPLLGVPVGELAYPAMRELVDLLQAGAFRIWVCSAGTTELTRILAERLYGIPRHHIIGSVLADEFHDAGGEVSIRRRPRVLTINDYEAKPVLFARQTGRRPVLAVGNLQCRGDLPMLRFCQARVGPGLQLLIHHDDPQRELTYQVDDSMMLDVSRKSGFTVVSLKHDWRQVLSTQVRTIVVDVTQLAARPTSLQSPAPAPAPDLRPEE
jgi:phosphoserine phosphatase